MAWLALSTYQHMSFCFFFSSRRRHTRFKCDWSSDVCSSDLAAAPVAYEQLATNMPTPQKPHQQALPGTDRGHRFVALPVHRIAQDHPLILFVSGPVNITHVMIRDKDPAILRSPSSTLTLLQPAACQHGRHWATAPNIGAGIEGIA